MSTRRSFLKWLGAGAGAAIVVPALVVANDDCPPGVVSNWISTEPPTNRQQVGGWFYADQETYDGAIAERDKWLKANPKYIYCPNSTRTKFFKHEGQGYMSYKFNVNLSK